MQIKKKKIHYILPFDSSVFTQFSEFKDYSYWWFHVLQNWIWTAFVLFLQLFLLLSVKKNTQHEEVFILTLTLYALSAFAVVCFLIAPCLSSFLSSSFSSSSSLHILSLLFFMVMSPLFILDLRLFLKIYLKNEHPKPINCCCRLRRNCRHPRHHLCLICILYFSDFRSKENSVCVFYSLRSRACRAHCKPTQCYRHL